MWLPKLLLQVNRKYHGQKMHVKPVLHTPDASCLFLECGSYINGGITSLTLSDSFKTPQSLETTKQLAY